ncbi:hypothetical protein G6F31_015918 [Rhizopus arrhizus]|nr:hypothetical protein G6F31_015918 [Rhizopus arrhizus]
MARATALPACPDGTPRATVAHAGATASCAVPSAAPAHPRDNGCGSAPGPGHRPTTAPRTHWPELPISLKSSSSRAARDSRSPRTCGACSARSSASSSAASTASAGWPVPFTAGLGRARAVRSGWPAARTAPAAPRGTRARPTPGHRPRWRSGRASSAPEAPRCTRAPGRPRRYATDCRAGRSRGRSVRCHWRSGPASPESAGYRHSRSARPAGAGHRPSPASGGAPGTPPGARLRARTPHPPRPDGRHPRSWHRPRPARSGSRRCVCAAAAPPWRAHTGAPCRAGAR